MKQDQDIPFEHHLFVCKGSQCTFKCPAPDGEGPKLLKDQLKENFKNLGLKGIVRVSQSSCMGQCEHAPNIMDYPSGVWYREVQAEDLKGIEEDVLRRMKQPGN